ncbi:DUF1543 domain-containing protein [Flavobacterium sp. LMO8]|uniref:DUF1543 domain-containing protein n=1 Tax=Flavobacterium sp. LMO8 TaxID=2654244 RepID=UPI001291C29E|nr:DUF1543 domain-containing protein [Flavobacterium sp. LMO8]MQP23573.1 DUF1543 domain-containing protein [Flavobacterium sp. LMO8]
MKTVNLHMIMLGCTPKGRYTEQHDIFFGIGTSLKELIPDMNAFWPEAKGKIHIDAWQKVTSVDGFTIKVVSKEENLNQDEQLFFLNLGGYKEGEFEEYHYKVLVVAKTKAEAIKKAKQTTFFKHCGFKGAESHIDDKYGVDVDDVHKIEDILSKKFKLKYRLKITKTNVFSEDEKNIGYLKIDKISV